MEVFDFVKAISNTKEPVFNEQTESAYVPFIVNRALSYHSDCIFHTQAINKHGIPKDMHYAYLFAALPKRKRFAPWAKLKPEPIVETLQRVYKYSLQRAIEAAKIFSEEQKKEFIKLHSLGGNK